MYQPPPFEIADKLRNEIKDFLISCGGHYAERYGEQAEDEHILLSIATGQFLYRKGCYFVCWHMVDDVELLMDGILPEDICNGDKMFIFECGVKSNIADMKRKLRQRGIKGAYWHRVNKGFKLYPQQKGGRYGRK